MKRDHYLRILNSQVVGYQNLDVVDANAGGFTYLVGTLPGVNVDKTQIKLGDFKVVSPEGGLTSEGSVYISTFTTSGQIDGEFVYIDQAQVDAGTGGCEEPGWYTKYSIEQWMPEHAEGEIIPFGMGVIIQSDCGAKITCAGEVVKIGTDIVINSENEGGFTYTGNCSPVDINLEDIAVTPPEGGLTSAGSVYISTFTSAGQIDGEYVYIDQAQVDAGTGGVETPGWYTKYSIEQWTPESAGNVQINAGQMFIVQSDCGATITIPSAL